MSVKTGQAHSAIARHLKRDRKTIRAYLNDERVAGKRRPAGPDPFEPYVDYVRARLTEDPHPWAATPFDEVVALGYDKAYSTFTRQLRTWGLRPHCEPCRATKGRVSAGGADS
jgi:transposase